MDITKIKYVLNRNTTPARVKEEQPLQSVIDSKKSLVR